MRGLLIKQPWIDLILDGAKTWELRGSRPSIRGPFALIAFLHSPRGTASTEPLKAITFTSQISLKI